MGSSKWSWGSGRSKSSKKSSKQPIVPQRIEPIEFKDWTPEEEERVEAMQNYTISSASSRQPRSEDETTEFISPIGPRSERVVYEKCVLDVGIGKDRRAKNGAGAGGVGETMKKNRGRRASSWTVFMRDIRAMWREKAMYQPDPALKQTVLQA